MKAYEARFPWMPPPSKVPSRIQRLLLPFTPFAKGWTIWYEGKTRFVCAASVPLAEIPDRWAKAKAAIDAANINNSRPRSGRTLREALGGYFAWLDHRVGTDLPKPLAAVSAEDYKRHLTALGRHEGEKGKLADLPLAVIGPEEFQSFAGTLSERSPTSFARIVATVRGFFSYCVDEGYLASRPNFGRYFVRPPQQQIRDQRLEQKKAWEQGDLWRIVEHADVQERAWIGLALSGAMDNADIAHLTFDLFDEDGLVIDYRRRKTGRVPRLIPIHGLAREWLDKYLVVRPKPAAAEYANLVFLTPTGLPLQRTKPGKAGIGNHVDYVAGCWDKLLRKAGLRAKAGVTRVCVVCGKPRKVPRATCCGQRKYKKSVKLKAADGPDYKGFRSLRTTFANFVPRGFSDERKLVMGHSGADITLEHYVERFGADHLRALVEAVWIQAFTARTGIAES